MKPSQDLPFETLLIESQGSSVGCAPARRTKTTTFHRVSIKNDIW